MKHVHELCSVGQKNVHVCCYVTRANAIDLNVMLTPFVTERLCELSERSFGRSIRRYCESALESEKGTEIDDLAAPQRNHMSTGGLREQPDRFKINVNDLRGKQLIMRYDDITKIFSVVLSQRASTMGGTYIVPITFSEIDAWRPALDTSTIDEDVDLAHYIKCLLKDPLCCLEVSQVTIDNLDPDPKPSNDVECS